MYKGVIDNEPVRPNFAKRRDLDLDRDMIISKDKKTIIIYLETTSALAVLKKSTN